MSWGRRTGCYERTRQKGEPPCSHLEREYQSLESQSEYEKDSLFLVCLGDIKS